MKLFSCQNCQQVVYFENTSCERCGYSLGYIPELETISAVERDGVTWRSLADPEHPYRFCENWERNACNWLVIAGGEQPYCEACRHNDVVPDTTDPKHQLQWQRIEDAKRRLFYSLIKLKLPIPDAQSGAPEPLVFNFLANAPGQKKVMTGHDNGLITIALEEADDSAREKLRATMAETYRTLLGHFRHEVGHYYWDLLVRDQNKLDGFRAIFGDERADYTQALETHYKTGAPHNWSEAFVSAYATVHPWEDFAETWAHYIHIVDTLEMAYAFGMKISTRARDADTLAVSIDQNPYRARDIATIVDAWLPLTTAVNNLNRTMGQPDIYPFVLSAPAIAKLGYVHELVHAPSVQP
jgi:hypothetical protein